MGLLSVCLSVSISLSKKGWVIDRFSLTIGKQSKRGGEGVGVVSHLIPETETNIGRVLFSARTTKIGILSSFGQLPRFRQ